MWLVVLCYACAKLSFGLFCSNYKLECNTRDHGEVIAYGAFYTSRTLWACHNRGGCGLSGFGRLSGEPIPRFYTEPLVLSTWFRGESCRGSFRLIRCRLRWLEIESMILWVLLLFGGLYRN